MKNTYTFFFELLLVLTEKELRVRYKYTILGFLWMVINPLFQMLLIGVIFTFFMKQQLQYYYYFLFLNLLIWNFFSLSLSRATSSIVTERELIKKAPFPRSVIPLSFILSNLFHMTIGLILFSASVLPLKTFNFLSIPVLLAALFLLLVFAIGVSLFTCALNVRFRDVNFLVQAILMLWFYATPIVYTLELIPKQITWIWAFNPMVSILQLFQHSFLNYPLPLPHIFLVNSLLTGIVFILGVFLFRHESVHFDDKV